MSKRSVENSKTDFVISFKRVKINCRLSWQREIERREDKEKSLSKKINC